MINLDSSHQISDVIHESILYSGLEQAIISTPIFNRLHRILQSSLVFLTFPSNKVKRFEHSIGTMYIAGEMFFNSICNAETEVIHELLETIKKEIGHFLTTISTDKISHELRDWGVDELFEASPYPKSSFYSKYFPGNLTTEDSFTYFVALESIRVAGLLHDVGHLPYSHIVEFALKNLYNFVKREKAECKVPLSPSKKEFLEAMRSFAEGKDEIHEEFGKILINRIEQSIEDSMSITQKNSSEYYFFLLVFYFAKQILLSNYADANIYSDLHLIISGVIDADRLDYCSRDAFCSGLDKNIFPYKRFLDSYVLINSSNHFYFCPSSKNVSLVEELLQRRYRIYSEINYHHNVHKHEIILEKVLFDEGLKELEESRQVENIKVVLPLEVSSIWKLVKQLKSRSSWLEYQLIQLDDSWLDTLLKHKFFESYGKNYSSLKKYGNEFQWNLFDELISTTKRYHSLIKRSYDYNEIDRQIFIEFCKMPFSSKQLEDLKILILKNVNPAQTDYNNVYSEFIKKEKCFFLNYIFKNIPIFVVSKEFKTEFFLIVERTYNARSADVSITNCIVRSCQFNNGYDSVCPVNLVSNNGGIPLSLDLLSTQREILLKEEALSIPFHFYYLPAFDLDNMKVATVEKSKAKIILAVCIIDSLVNILDSHE